MSNTYPIGIPIARLSYLEEILLAGRARAELKEAERPDNSLQSA
jgi:hypothetical protein